MNNKNNENENSDLVEGEIDIKKLNELEKEKFEKNFESIISFKESNEPKQKEKLIEQDNALSSSTSASGEDNPFSKLIALKSKIDKMEKEIRFYSEHKELINFNESIEECFVKYKKLKESINFISKSNNFYKLKKIIDSQKLNREKKIENYQIIQNEMYDNLHLHLINRANIINKLKIENPGEYSDIDYELYITPETKKVKKITKLIEIKNKLNNIKAKIGEWDLEKNKNNLTSVVDELKMNIKLLDPNFKKDLENQKNIINKRVKEMNFNDEFYDAIDKAYLDDLYTGFKNGQEIENIIADTVSKMESLKEGHENSAFLGLKMKEMIEQQEKLGNEINENNQILINLKKNIKNNIQVMKKNIELLKAKINSKK